MHDKNIPNFGDISKINVEDIPEHDLFTYSWPCTDISIAGKQEGIIRGKTRSGLLYECERIIEHCKPKYLLMENVKNLVGKKFKPQFDEWLVYLKSLGYTSYWKVLNAKDYGVPQNRERVFVISILGEHKPYKFADKIPLDKCIADILEDKVDEKYYLSEEIQNRLTMVQKDNYIVEPKKLDTLDFVGGIGDKDWVGDNKKLSRNYPQGNRVYSDKGIACSQTSNGGGLGGSTGLYLIDRQPKILCEGNINPSGKGMNGNVFNVRGISPTLTTNKGEGQKIILPCIAASRGRYIDSPSSGETGNITEQRLEFNTKGTSNTITTVQKDNYVVETTYRIRKLTPRECFRLMGMRDDDIDKIQQAGISNTQQYKMAGNSIVVDVLEAIFRNLFLD